MRDIAACGLDEEQFRAFHARTARPLRAYLVRLCRDRALAEDVVQDAYLRFLGAHLPETADEAYRRSYLYRIATNLLRDHFRRARVLGMLDDVEAVADAPAAERLAEEVETRRDVTRALDRLTPKERQLLWLAYVERFSHKEIAAIVGFRPDSVRPVLFRARQKLASLLRARGPGQRTEARTDTKTETKTATNAATKTGPGTDAETMTETEYDRDEPADADA